ncbi:uncharacterized protein LOC135169249 [Diachasmimorpha longicaudata]|uniref:uncharacterized protein LOC135169249 n=1 Tax=Diachasmimorpha longicaudata TaxID=58733 RepID=UPI0030B8E8E3
MMRKANIFIILSLLFGQWTPTKGIPTISHAEHVPSWTTKVFNFILSGITEEVTSKLFDTCSSASSFGGAIFKKVSTHLYETDDGLESASDALAIQHASHQNPSYNVTQVTKFKDTVYKLMQSTEAVEDIYLQFVRQLPLMSDDKLCGFITDSLYGPKGLMSHVQNKGGSISLVTETTLKTLESVVQGFQDPGHKACGNGHSPLEYIHSIFHAMLKSESKALIMLTYVQRFSSLFGQAGKSCGIGKRLGDVKLDKLRSNFESNIESYHKIFIPKMEGLSRDFRTCDQDEDFMRYETFLELEGLYQGILLPPRSLGIGNPESDKSCESVDTISGNSKYYCDSKSHFCLVPEHHRCYGRIWQCKSYERIDACQDKHGPRRYRWVFLNQHRQRERIFDCPDDERITLLTEDKKQPCLCQCLENTVDSMSTHLISLQPVESDVENNMVITGIKFVIKHGILQFQIQQGELKPHWNIDTAEWKPINDIGEEIRAARLGINYNGKPPKVKENEDFLVIKLGENNGINFDELEVPFGYVLTGVKFILADKKKEKSPKRVEIALIATRLHRSTGTLCLDCRKRTVKSNVVHDQEYKLKTDLDPHFPTFPDSGKNQYVLIQSSTVKKEGAQTTLPLFDAVPLVTNPPTPVSGLGIFQKTPVKGDFTGFVALKFLSLDYVQYMKNSMVGADRCVTVSKPRRN